jgi:hypothetical protein
MFDCGVRFLFRGNNMIEKAVGDGVFGEPWLMDGVSSLG